MVVVGVLSLQGDFLEHIQLLATMSNVKPKHVKMPRDLSDVDALIIPGGESTTIGRLMKIKGLDKAVVDFAREGRPVMGTCAGAILLAKSVVDRVVGKVNQPILELMDIAVVRNAFGRQRESFETNVLVEGLGSIKVVFIRAPAIIDAWGDAKIISYIDYPDIGRVGAVAVQRNMLAVAFHPEISGDTKLYEHLISMSRR